MDIHQYTQTLRLHLLDMSRVSQRGVDYAIKAYRLGSLEFCESVLGDSYEINILHGEITEIARELLLADVQMASDLRLVLSSQRICSALKALHSQAAEIAVKSMRLLQSGREFGCTDIAKMGDVVNCLVRLCVVALFDERIEHAKVVLHSDGVERLFEEAFFGRYKNVNPAQSTLCALELAITRSLSQMAKKLTRSPKQSCFGSKIWMQRYQGHTGTNSFTSRHW